MRRTRFLRFDFLPPVEDVTLKAKLARERDGVFRWMLDDLRELLTLPLILLGGPQSRAVHDRFRISNDPVGAFVATRCQLHPAAKVGKDTLQEAFKDFCERHDISPAVGAWFFRNLYERWPQLRETRPGETEGQRRRYVAGLELKP